MRLRCCKTANGSASGSWAGDMDWLARGLSLSAGLPLLIGSISLLLKKQDGFRVGHVNVVALMVERAL